MKGVQQLNNNLKDNLKHNLSLESWVSFLVVVFVPCLARHSAAVIVLVPWLTCSYCSGLQNNWTKKLVFGRQANVATLLFALLCQVALNENHQKLWPTNTAQTDARRVLSTVCVVLCCVVLCACGVTRGWNQTHGLFLVLVWLSRGAAHGRPNPATC